MKQRGLDKVDWNVMSREERRELVLKNLWIDPAYLRSVVLDNDGTPCLPNFYHGGSRGAWMPMRNMGLFTEKEIEEAKVFVEARNGTITTA